MTGNNSNYRDFRMGRRILVPLTIWSLIVILMVACTLPVAGANVTATATTTATTATVSPTATATTSATATHTATQTTTATTTATSAASTTSTTTATTTATTAVTTAVTSVATTSSTSQVKPTAGFSADHLSGLPPLDVQFTDLSTGGPVSWTWDFGDGESSTDQNPSHTYDTAGGYTVTLTVVNRQGTSSDPHSESNYITVDEATATPTETATATATATESTTLAAKFSGSPVNGSAPLTVTFTDASTGSPDAWSWDFGDDSSSTDKNPAHTYQNSGLYTVTLKVSKSGDTDQTRKESYITVSGSSGASANTQDDTTPIPTLMKKSQLSGTTIPTPVVRTTQAQPGATQVLTGQAWLDRENKKLADAEAAASGQPSDIVTQIVGFFKGIFHWK